MMLDDRIHYKQEQIKALQRQLDALLEERRRLYHTIDHTPVAWSPTGKVNSPVSCELCGRYLYLDHEAKWTHA